MKWQKMGHELDAAAETYLKSFCERGEKIYVFGAGYFGSEVRSVVERMGCFEAFLDNDKKKQQSGVAGYRVLSLEEYMLLPQKGWLVIAIEPKHIPEIAAQLAKRGLSEDDYFTWPVFLKRIFPILMTYHYDRSYTDIAQISVTERCSLRCKKCAHGCGYVDSKSQDMAIEEVMRSADIFFSKIDLIREFVLIGGEPLLYRELPKAVAYIGERYRDKIIHFCITTNGTLFPTEELLDVCRQYQVMFQISNYSLQLPNLTEKYERLTEMLATNEIEYKLGDAELKWTDFGFEFVNRREDEAELQNVFDCCQTSCREIRGNNYYFCVMARSVSENMGFHVGKDDFLDLDQLPEDYKKILLEFELGYSSKGYLDMCRHCNGAEAEKYPIQAAEQMP